MNSLLVFVLPLIILFELDGDFTFGLFRGNIDPGNQTQIQTTHIRPVRHASLCLRRGVHYWIWEILVSSRLNSSRLHIFLMLLLSVSMTPPLSLIQATAMNINSWGFVCTCVVK